MRHNQPTPPPIQLTQWQRRAFAPLSKFSTPVIRGVERRIFMHIFVSGRQRHTVYANPSQMLLDWGLTSEQIEQTCGFSLPAVTSTLLKDAVNANGGSFPAVKEALQALIP